MADPVSIFGPYKTNIRRGNSSGYPDAPNYGGSNKLFAASSPSDQRRCLADLNSDIHRNISAAGRRQLVTAGKRLYANFPVIRGAVSEMGYYSVGVWLPQFYGEDETWGSLAEEGLYEHDKVYDLSGRSMLDYYLGIIRGVIVEGDCLSVLTEIDGEPKIQLLPGHRLSSDSEDVIKTGRFAGASLVDGVITNRSGSTIGYRVNTEDGPVELDTSEAVLHFIQEYPGQLRGFSQLACVAFACLDVQESRDLELAYQKLASSTGIAEWNEAGEVDAAKAAIRAPTTAFANDQKIKSWVEKVEGVTNRYFRANSGSKIEEFFSNRPGPNSREFTFSVMREILYGIGWSIDLVDPSKIGGAPQRVAIERVNKTIKFLQDTVAEPAFRRFHAHRMPRLMGKKQIPFNRDWWKFYPQGPAKLTADEKYSSDVAIQEIRAGIKSEQQACAERNENWRDVMDRKIAYEKRLQEKCKAEGVNPNRIVLLTPNGNAAVSTTPATDQTPTP